MVFYEKSRKKKKIISILNTADMVIALSQDWKEKFEKTFNLKNCRVLENGIDMERLAPAITKYEEHPYALVMLGRLGERKGTYDLIRAIEIVKNTIPDVVCYLAGDGEIQKCSAVVTEDGIEDNIKIVGWVEFEKKLDLLKKTGILILPSYNEGLPMAILEGMACGKVIISTNVGAIPEVVKEENGILISPGNIQSLAEAIIKCCTQKDYVENISRNNISKIEEGFSMISMHKKLSSYYQYVMKKS